MLRLTYQCHEGSEGAMNKRGLLSAIGSVPGGPMSEACLPAEHQFTAEELVCIDLGLFEAEGRRRERGRLPLRSP